MLRIAATSISLIAFLALVVPVQLSPAAEQAATDRCSYKLVETMPVGLTFENELPFSMAQTHEVYLDLINKAQNKIQIASFYMSLLTGNEKWDEDPSAEPGRLVLEALESAARDRKLQVDIVVGMTWTITEEWDRYLDAGINIKVLNVTQLLGDGVQHSKFIITDDKNFYVGSANWDWRALTQVKEFGILYEDCQSLASDLKKVFETYWYFAGLESHPGDIPEHLKTKINQLNPLVAEMDGVPSEIYMGTSPAAFDGTKNGRDSDLRMILDTIGKARKFVYISVMNYSPVENYKSRRRWGFIDDAIRDAYRRGVNVKLLVSKTRPNFYYNQINWFKSLDTCGLNRHVARRIEVNYYEVPKFDEFQASVPFTRLKHDKYMVTDNAVYVGTSNWEGNYFINSCGVGISVHPRTSQTSANSESIITKMKAIFERDFYSPYSKNIRDYQYNVPVRRQEHNREPSPRA